MPLPTFLRRRLYLHCLMPTSLTWAWVQESPIGYFVMLWFCLCLMGRLYAKSRLCMISWCLGSLFPLLLTDKNRTPEQFLHSSMHGNLVLAVEFPALQFPTVLLHTLVNSSALNFPQAKPNHVLFIAVSFIPTRLLIVSCRSDWFNMLWFQFQTSL